MEPIKPPTKRQITAIYAGKCHRCRASYRPGDGVWIVEGQQGVTCAYCMGGLK